MVKSKYLGLDVFVKMATGTVLASLTGLKSRDSGLGFEKKSGFCDFTKSKCSKRILNVMRNSNSSSNIAELQPASEVIPRQKYCESIYKTTRRKTRTVMVGNVAMGGEHSIRFQTTTTTDTKDVAGTVEQDGLGDIIRVSLTEAPEEEIYPCRILANLGMRAAELQKGVAPFEEKHRHYFDFHRRSGQLPIQKKGEEVDYGFVLHRDGSVLMSVSLDQLKAPELLYKSLAAKLVVGMPFKDLATVDSILLRELPPVDNHDARLALKRLVDISMGVITPLSEQLTKPLPHAMVLVNLKELSTGAYKLLPEGTRLVISLRGDEPYEELEIIKDIIDATMILHDLPFNEDKVGRVQAARRLFEYLSENNLNFPVIHHIQFPRGIHRDDLVIGAGTNVGALLVDGLGDGLLLEAPRQDFDFLRNTSFNLLQGCRMRNSKTEYVTCSSCSRTLFDIEEVSAEIREKTSHLPGVSIAVIGCIVNGPGEMADADFGYVGGAPGKINLYVGKTLVKRGIAAEHAADALIQLIKDHGRWVDPLAEE